MPPGPVPPERTGLFSIQCWTVNPKTRPPSIGVMPAGSVLHRLDLSCIDVLFSWQIGRVDQIDFIRLHVTPWTNTPSSPSAATAGPRRWGPAQGHPVWHPDAAAQSLEPWRSTGLTKMFFFQVSCRSASNWGFCLARLILHLTNGFIFVDQVLHKCNNPLDRLQARTRVCQYVWNDYPLSDEHRSSKLLAGRGNHLPRGGIVRVHVSWLARNPQPRSRWFRGWPVKAPDSNTQSISVSSDHS